MPLCKVQVPIGLSTKPTDRIVPAARIVAHLLSRTARGHVKHLVLAQGQWWRKVAAIPTTGWPLFAAARENGMPRAGKTDFAGQSKYAAANCRRRMIAEFSFRLSSHS